MPPTVACTSATSRAPRRAPRAGVALLSLALVLTVPACDAAIGPLFAPDESSLQLGSGGDDPLSSNKSVVVAPSEVTLNAIGRSRQLSVTVRNGNGRLVVNPNVTWTSLNPEVATVNASGLIQSVGVGTVLITATALGSVDTATVQVRQVVAAVAVSPDTATVEVSGTHTFNAMAADSNGVAIPDVTLTWSSSDPTAAIVMANGEATGVDVGTATIAATADVGGAPIVGSAALTVVPAGSPPPPPPGVATVTVTPTSATIQTDSTLQLTAAALDADGNPLARPFTWTSATPAIATVTSSGLVRAVSAGVVGIMAEAEGVGAVSIVTVQAPAPPAPPPPPPPPPPPGGYSPTTPHWSHIRTEVTDFRIRYQGTAAQSAEYDWTAAHYDVVMDGPARAFKTRNSQIKTAPYQIALAFMQTAQSGDINALQAWYADPTKNTQGYNIEDAFLHTALPKSPSNRVTYTIWGSARWAMNAGDPGFRAFLTDRIRSRIYADPQYPADGIFIDEHDTQNIDRARGAVEYPNWEDFYRAIDGLWAYVRPRLDGKYIQLNPAEFGGQWMDRFLVTAGAAHLEHFHYAMREVVSRWERAERLIAQGVDVTLVGNWRLESYNSQPDAVFSRGNHLTKGGRGKMFELAGYYMIRPAAANIDQARLANLNTWQQPFSTQWLRAYETNVGHPREARRVYASGTDPSGLPYRVHSRTYDNALVLARSVFDWSQQDRCGDNTGVTVTLPSGNSWYMLFEDGNLGSAPLTSVTLRNCEAVILMKG